jgi:hypothetical protein
VAQPEIIEELFSARYDRDMGLFADKAQSQARYEAILEQATKQFRCSREELLKFLRGRYREWVRKNKLPQPPKE